MIVIASNERGEYRFGPLSPDAAERLVGQLAILGGLYFRIQIVESDDIDVQLPEPAHA